MNTEFLTLELSAAKERLAALAKQVPTMKEEAFLVDMELILFHLLLAYNGRKEETTALYTHPEKWLTLPSPFLSPDSLEHGPRGRDAL